MPKYHINPSTGDPGVCKARIACRFGGETDHFDSPDVARRNFERRMESLDANINTLRNDLAILAPFESSSFNSIEFRSNWIHEWPTEWSPQAKENLYNVFKIQEHLTQSTMTQEDWDTVKEIKDHLHQEGPVDPNNIGHQGLINQINGLASDLIIQRRAYDYPWAYSVPARPEMKGVEGLEEAREGVVQAFNTDNYASPNDYLMGKDVPGYMDQTIDRIVQGEKYDLADTPNDGYALSLIPERDRLMSVLSNPDSPNFNSHMYLSTVFPEKELKSAMDRSGLRGVTVERGGGSEGTPIDLSYSVDGADGSKRRFTVTEKFDEISIVADKPNEPGARPFELTVHKDERDRAAEALVFFMRESQDDVNKNGTSIYDSADTRTWKDKFDNSDLGYIY